jgi:DNA gyrase subunit A
MLVTNAGKLIRMPIRSISVISRNTQGVKLIEMEEGETLVGAATLVKDDSDGEDASDTEEAPAEPDADTEA